MFLPQLDRDKSVKNVGFTSFASRELGKSTLQVADSAHHFIDEKLMHDSLNASDG